MSNTLCIIGNGFDLAHGLKTLYSDYYESMPKSLQRRWEKILGEYKVEGDYWVNFEEAIDYLTASWYNDYFMNTVTNDDENIKILNEKINEINNIFEELTSNLLKYLATVEEKNELRKLSSIEHYSKEGVLALSFNYTKTPNLYFEDIYYIHGSIEEKRIVLGYKLRTEHSGIVSEATTFYKAKLREFLNFSRYLAYLELHQEDVDKYMQEFESHLERLFTNRGEYCVEYHEETLREYFEYMKSTSKEFSGFKYFGTPQRENLPKQIEDKMRKERLEQISQIVNDYGEVNGFSTFPINLGCNLEEITEIIILGHSLGADKELIESIFFEATNLKKVVLFTYNGEDPQEVERKKAFLYTITLVPIETVLY